MIAMDMDELAKLRAAIESDRDLGACEEVVARNFPAFLENDFLKTFPDEVLYGVLSHPCITFPDPPITASFFVNLFDRGEGTVKILFEVIPFDELSLESCERIATKLDELGCDAEARRMRRVKNLYARLEERATDHTAISDQLAHSSELLERMTTILKNTSDALKHTTDELGKKGTELRQKDAIISRLRAHKRGKR
jgi:hypothetical protein